MLFSIHIGAVILAAIACFVIGFLFHGPLFGRVWMRLANIHPTGNEKFSDMYGQMFWNFVANIVMAVVLAVTINIANASGFFMSNTSAGVASAVLLWIAMSANASIEVIWMGRKVPHWLFEVGTSFICAIAMGLILAHA